MFIDAPIWSQISTGLLARRSVGREAHTSEPDVDQHRIEQGHCLPCGVALSVLVAHIASSTELYARGRSAKSRIVVIVNAIHACDTRAHGICRDSSKRREHFFRHFEAVVDLAGRVVERTPAPRVLDD